MTTKFEFNKEIIRRADYTEALCKEIRGLMTKAGCSHNYMRRIETRVVKALGETGYLDGIKIQGELSRATIHELKEALKTPSQKIHEQTQAMTKTIHKARYEIAKSKARP